MFIFQQVTDIRYYLDTKRLANIEIGLVPTMGALHNGHLSLIKQSKKQTGLTVCSIFINPTQFNDQKDYEKYPVTIHQDIHMLLKAGCDVLFLPSAKEFYPQETSLLPHFNLGYLETVLEGKFRPGHFQGVCQAVDRLLKITEPDFLFMGQKDFQQCMVVKKLIELTGVSTQLMVGPTVREDDGLAMSSRNTRLNEAQRKKATAIFETLSWMKNQLQPGNVVQLKQTATSLLEEQGFGVDYTELAKAETLELMNEWNGTDEVVALIAAYVDEVRLIDNSILTS